MKSRPALITTVYECECGDVEKRMREWKRKGGGHRFVATGSMCIP